MSMRSTAAATVEATAATREAADGFFLAAEHGRSDVIKALADHSDGRIDLAHIVDAATGRTPLHVAVVHHKTDAVRVLLAAGFPPHIESIETTASGKKKCTAYALAVEAQAHDLVFVFHQFAVQQVAMDNAQGVAELLAAGVPMGVTDGVAMGNTLLHWAVTCRALAVCRFLLEREHAVAATLVNHANTEGATPLHIACRDGKLEFVRLLLSHGADPRCTGTGGFCKDMTPADLVTSTEIRELLTRHEERLVEVSAKTERDKSKSHVDPATEAQDSAASSATTEIDMLAAVRRKHALQLEEKDLLIRQLKTTIETLVVEAQEIRKLGEERTVLDYIRKLREEKNIVRRQLEDAEDHMRIQQQQIHELKRQIRSMEVQPQPQSRPSLTLPQQQQQQQQRRSIDTEIPIKHNERSSPIYASVTEASVPSRKETTGLTTEDNESIPPLQLDATAPRSRRLTPPRSASGAWNDVWSVLVGNGLQADDVDADGEVIMTV